MSYNTRGGVRMNRPYGGGGGGGGYGGNHPPSGGGGGYHGNQNTSYTQPAYSTPTNYQKQPVNDSRPPYQQNQHQPPPQKAPQQVPPPPLQQPPAPPILKDPTPPVVQAQPPPQQPEPKQENDDKNNDASMDTSEEGTEGGTPRRPKFRPWNKRGAPGIKITRKMRKRRQNARLRNLLAPKNAMMVLHELHPELKMVISEQVNAANQTAYTVEIEVEGKIFRGHGMSKMSAKQSASENALKAVLLEKLEQNNLKINPDNTLSSEGSTNNEGGSTDVVMKEEGAAPAEGEEGAPPRPGRRPVEDDVPWGSLASFALFKLFSEWQSQGFQLPPSGLPPVFHKSAGAKKIPEDANKKHPVQLLNQIRPGSQYSESREGTPPNLTFKFTVVIDGQTFVGVGSNKKDAKKECAKHALEALGVKYD